MIEILELKLKDKLVIASQEFLFLKSFCKHTYNLGTLK